VAAGAARTLSASDRYTDAQDVRFDMMVEQLAGEPRTGELEGLDAVEAVRSATFVFGGLDPGSEHQSDLGRQVETSKDFGDRELVDALVFAGSSEPLTMRVVEGRLPDPEVPTEFVVSRDFAEETGTRIGDRVRLVTVSTVTAEAAGFAGGVPDGPSFEAELVGTVRGPAELQDDYMLAVFPGSLLAAGDIGVASTQHVIQLSDGSSQADLRRQLDALGGDFGIDDSDEVVPTAVRDAVTARGTGVAIVALIIAIATIVVFGQLLGRQFRLSAEQSVILHSIGASSRQLVAETLARAAVPVVAGTVLGAGIAIACSGLFPLGFVEVVEPDPGVRIEPLVHLGGGLLFAAALVTWVAVAATTRRHPGPARRPSVVDDVASRVRPLAAATAIRFGFARSSRDSGSPLSSHIGLFVMTIVLVGALTFGSSVARVIDEPGRYGSPDVGLGQGGSEMDPATVAALRQSPFVSAASLASTIAVSVGERTIDLTGIDPIVGRLTAPLLVGRLPTEPDEVALGRVTARDLGVDVDDEIPVSTDAGNRRLRITGLAVIPGIGGGDGIGRGGIITAAAMKLIDPTATYGDALVDVAPDAPDDAAGRLGAMLGTEVGPFDPPAAIVSLDRIRALPTLVAVILGLLAALTLAHQLIVSARRRRHDRAILGVLGSRRGWLGWVIHWQATITVAATVLLAVPLGYALGRFAVRGFIDRIGAVSEPFLPAWVLVVVIGAALLVANVVAAVPARRVRRQSLAGQLAGE